MTKKLVFLAISVSLTFLALYTYQSGKKDSNKINDSVVSNNTSLAIFEETETMTMSDRKISFSLPEEYSITKSSETNRLGSFESYELFAKASLPTFYEIRFSDEESIKTFLASCEKIDPRCIDWGTSSLEKYNGQKKALLENTEYEGYEKMILGNYTYFIKSTPCEGDSCILREYSTFIGDIKVDVIITMENKTQESNADSLFEQFQITE